MLYTLTLKLDAFHKPSETWHCYDTTHGVRAVSRKHALDKGLNIVTGWPGYTDRAGHPDWTVDASVSFAPATS
jgi:hypothetical protein